MKKGIRYLVRGALVALSAGMIWLLPAATHTRAAVRVSSVKIKNVPKNLLINKKEKKRLRVTIKPGAARKKLIWRSSKKSVVAVNSKGVIRGKKYGRATVTARAADGSGKKASIRVQVGRKVSRVSLPAASMELDVKASSSVKGQVTPSNATKRKLTYRSSKKSVATVSSSGVVYGKAKGTALITATAQDGSGKKAVCRVQVKVPTRSVVVDADASGTRLQAGQKFTINAYVEPENASNKRVNFTSSNPAVAEVSQSGVVTGVAAGTAVIRVDAADGRSSASVEVEVYKVELKDEKLIAHRGLSSEAPENTTAAFKLAIQGGFYGVECDVRKTLDDNFVIMHDADLNRMCGYNLTVANMDVNQLKKYPVITGNNIDKYPGLTVPTLDEYLEIMAESQTIHPFIELKEELTVSELKMIVKKVKDYGLLERTYFISVHKPNLVALKEIEGVQEEYLQYVYGAEASNKLMAVDNDVISWCINNGIDLDARHTLISADDVYRLHEAGRKVNVWTVNLLAKAYELVTNANVDMITTEYRLNS